MKTIHRVGLGFVLACFGSFALAVTLSENQASKLQKTCQRLGASEGANPLLAQQAQSLESGNREFSHDELVALLKAITAQMGSQNQTSSAVVNVESSAASDEQPGEVATELS